VRGLKTCVRVAYNQGIPRNPAELLSEALHLPTEARAALADSLLDSLDTEVDANAAEAWRDEIYRRLQEIDRGAAQLIPWQDVQRRLRARLQQCRGDFGFLRSAGADFCGHSRTRRLLLICFTEPERDRVRIISARRVTNKELHDYEDNVEG